MSEQNAPPRRPLGETESREVIEEALRLQSEAERRAEAERRLAEMAEAAREVGLDPEHVPLAEGLVRARAEEKARREVERRRLARGLGVAAVAAVVLGGVAVALWPSSPEFTPWSAEFTSPDWTLDVSPGSAATLGRDEFIDQGIAAEVSVQRLSPMADGRYWVNLDSTAHPDWAGAKRVAFKATGVGLGHVRLYLENGDERWRGPLLELNDFWRTYSVPLSNFERQEKRGDKWEVVRWRAPEHVDTTSFKLGWYVNDPESAGTVALDDLRVE